MNPNATTPEPQATIEQPVVVSTNVEPQLTPQQTDRAAAIANYASLYQTSQPVTPAPQVSEPAAAEPVLSDVINTQPAGADISALQSTIDSLKAEIEALKPKPATPEPAQPVAQKAAMEQWVEFMAQGKYQEADDFLFKHFAPRLEAQLQPKLVQQATEASNAERQITSFISEFERANADLLPMKDYVVVGAERRLQIAQNEGKIKSTADFVREYQKAVTDEATELRTKLQITRGAGKQEAMTAQRQVLNATTLEPNAIQMPTNSQPAPPQSATDYIAMRNSKLRQIQGLGA